jgi:hypothetical protein
VTLILTVNGPETIWLLADRRLSYKGRPPKDDAHKVMFLETADAVAILGYAGLGATALGTEPADWMSAVLRGRNLPLEQSLGVLADAINRKFPGHVARLALPEPAHNVIISAFLGGEARLYTITLVVAPDRKTYRFGYARHLGGRLEPLNTRPPRMTVSEDGGLYLDRNWSKQWRRNLLCVVSAHDRGRVTSRAVANHLAKLNNDVHRNVESVGPRCIVVWRHRVSVHGRAGGHCFYTGTTEERSESLATIVTGIDMQALCKMQLPIFQKARRTGRPMDSADIKAGLARLPDKPDENLR